MKFIVIIILTVVLGSSTILSAFEFQNEVKAKDDQLISNPNSNSSTKVTQNDLSNKSIKNASLSSIDNNKVKGLLIVKIIVNNRNNGNKTPSDFIINIHANDPSPASFLGNSSGTIVKLGMGMYGVSESLVQGYVPLLSGDCYGGIMSIYAKQCTITNTYNTSPVLSK